LLLDQIFEREKVQPESGASFFGCQVTCIGFAPNESFFHQDIFFLFQCFQVRCQVTIGKVKQFFKRVKVVAFIGNQYAHDLQANAVFKGFIKLI